MTVRKVLGYLAIIILAAHVSFAMAADQPAAVYGSGTQQFSLATGSPGELGLLKVLAETFGKQNDAKMAWYKSGSGKSLQLLKDKKVDMIMVHAPAAEKQAVKDGWAAKRTLIGSNEFFIVGPASDPAKIAGAKDVLDAYRRIAGAKAKFFSRGDNSGTHKKEMDIWKKAGIKPAGDWYVVTKDFMTATLKRANKEKGYFMVDSSTWVAAKKEVPDLKILFKGDKLLVNTYHALCQPAGATPGAALAAKFIGFVASPQGQQIISDYGKDRYSEGLYNDAAYAKKFDD
ncbi:MAG: ABC transporter substrate-binding protein [Deltaproteobacteria bacterium]|nr:MAG: ABC transporter substrate-binding protein [Deltaproteobacteria bacterium]